MNLCPSDEDLTEFLSGEGVGAVGTHLRECLRCQQSVDRLSDADNLRSAATLLIKQRWNHPGDDTLMSIVDALRNESPFDPRRTPSNRPSHEFSFLEPARAAGMLGRLGPYDVEKEIGRGGMGVVFRARDSTTGRIVALKVLHACDDDARTRRRFIQEVRAAALVEHDNVVRLYATSDPDASVPYFAMEYLTGPSLAELNQRSVRIDPRELAEIIAQVAFGLQAAHAQGLVHSDVKPANILVDRSVPRAKIGDFGLARLSADEHQASREGLLPGTPAYLSPEQARGDLEPDPRSDVYSLGVTFYECLTGEIPFRGKPHRILHQIQFDEPRAPRIFNDAISRDLETICLKAMDKDRSKRYPTAADFADDLRRFLRGETILARPVSAIERTWRWCRNNRRVAVLTALAVCSLLAFAASSTIAAVAIARERTKAMEHARLSDVQRDLAVEAFNALIEGVQVKLASRPGNLELRRSLLQTARDGLGKLALAESGKSRPNVDDRSIVAMLKLGDIDVILGRSADARVEFETASKMAEQAVQANAKSVQLRRTLSSVYDRLGDEDKNNYTITHATGAFYEKALAIRRDLLTEHPEDPQVRRDLRISFHKLGGYHLSKNNFRKAREFFELALDALRKEPTGHENSDTGMKDFRYIYDRIGNVARREGRGKDSLVALRHSLDIAEALCKRDSKDGGSRLQRALALDYLGEASIDFGDYPGAERALTAFRDDRAAAVHDDASDLDALRLLALAHQHLGKLAFSRSDFNDARSESLEASKIFDEVARRDPTSVRAHKDRLIVLRQLANLEIVQDHYDEAVPWFDRELLIQAGKDAPPHSDQAGWIDEATFLRNVYTLATRAMEDPTLASKQSPRVANMLLKVRAIALANAGRVDEADKAAKELLAIPDNLAESRIAARTYALIVKSLAKECAEAQAPYRRALLEALSKAIKKDPSLAGFVVHDQAYESMKDDPGFRSLLGLTPTSPK